MAALEGKIANGPRVVTVTSDQAFDRAKARFLAAVQERVSDSFHHFFFSSNLNRELRGTQFGERLDRVVGMMAGGLYRVGRAVEEQVKSEHTSLMEAYRDPRMLKIVEDLSGMNAAIDATKTQGKAVIDETTSVSPTNDTLATVAEFVADISARLAREETVSPLERETAAGLALYLRGKKQLDAFLSLDGQFDIKSLSPAQLNTAWVSAMLGEPIEVTRARVLDPKPDIVVAAEALLGKNAPGSKEGYKPEVIFTADEGVSADNFTQIAAASVLSLKDEIVGNDMVSVHISQRGHNHFTLVLDTIDVSGERQQRAINFGTTFQYPYVDHSGEVAVDPHADEALYVVRKLGNVDFTQPDGVGRMNRAVLQAASLLGWNPRGPYEDSYAKRDSSHEFRPLRVGVPAEFTRAELLKGKTWDSEVTIIVDGQPVTKKQTARLEGAYSFVTRNVDRLQALVLEREARKLHTNQATVAESVPGSRFLRGGQVAWESIVAPSELRTANGESVSNVSRATLGEYLRFVRTFNLPDLKVPTALIEKLQGKAFDEDPSATEGLARELAFRAIGRQIDPMSLQVMSSTLSLPIGDTEALNRLMTELSALVQEAGQQGHTQELAASNHTEETPVQTPQGAQASKRAAIASRLLLSVRGAVLARQHRGLVSRSKQLEDEVNSAIAAVSARMPGVEVAQQRALRGLDIAQQELLRESWVSKTVSPSVLADFLEFVRNKFDPSDIPNTMLSVLRLRAQPLEEIEIINANGSYDYFSRDLVNQQVIARVTHQAEELAYYAITKLGINPMSMLDSMSFKTDQQAQDVKAQLQLLQDKAHVCAPIQAELLDLGDKVTDHARKEHDAELVAIAKRRNRYGKYVPPESRPKFIDALIDVLGAALPPFGSRRSA